jgi:hypothetical protein
MRRFMGPLVGLLLFAGLACGSDTGTVTVTGPTPIAALSSTRVSGLTELTAVGQTSQLTLTAVYVDGTTRDVTADATWTSAAAAIATVSRGVLTAVAFGSTFISAAYGGKTFSSRVTATPAGTFVAEGRVREPGGGGIANARVLEQISFTDTRTDNGGSFRFLALPSARFRVELDGYERFEQEISMPATPPRWVFVDAPVQRTMRMNAGQSTGTLTIAPNDVSYSVEGDFCNPCKLIRVISGGPATLTLRLAWIGPPGALKLWANNVRNSSTGNNITVNAPTGGGQSLIYVGWTQPAGQSGSQYINFTLSVD